MTTSTPIAISPLTANIGAEIRGVDLRYRLDDATIADIRRALLDHLVIFFRDQDITPRQQYDFAERFGPVEVGVLTGDPTEVPGVNEVSFVSPRGITDIWHADHTFMAAPPLGAVLRAVQVPSTGGDTCFASMYTAYERLSSPLRAMLDGLTAVNSLGPAKERLARQGKAYLDSDGNEARHPVVRVHPETGRKLLNVNSGMTARIVELEPAEGRALLSFLFEHLKSPEFQCRFRWEPDSVAVWDNRAVQHYAVADYDEPRVMRRTLIGGDAPVGPTQAHRTESSAGER